MGARKLASKISAETADLKLLCDQPRWPAGWGDVGTSGRTEAPCLRLSRNQNFNRKL